MLVRSSEAGTQRIAPKTGSAGGAFYQTRCRLASDGSLGDTALGTYIASHFPNGRLKARGGIVLFAGIITLLDWLGQRQERRAHKLN